MFEVVFCQKNEKIDKWRFKGRASEKTCFVIYLCIYFSYGENSGFRECVSMLCVPLYVYVCVRVKEKRDSSILI